MPDFPFLFDRGIPEESSALLLYSLLQSNTGFTDTLVRTGTACQCGIC